MRNTLVPNGSDCTKQSHIKLTIFDKKILNFKLFVPSFAEKLHLLSKYTKFLFKLYILEHLAALEYPSLLYCSRYSRMTKWVWLLSGSPCHVAHIGKHTYLYMI